MFTHAGSSSKTKKQKVMLNNLVVLSSNSKLLRGRIFPIEADKYENFYLRTKIRHTWRPDLVGRESSKAKVPFESISK